MISESNEKVDLFHTDLMIFTSDLKIVILGDASVGKTSLIQRYLEGIFTQDHTSVSVFCHLLLACCSASALWYKDLKYFQLGKQHWREEQGSLQSKHFHEDMFQLCKNRAMNEKTLRGVRKSSKPCSVIFLSFKAKWKCLLCRIDSRQSFI